MNNDCQFTNYSSWTIAAIESGFFIGTAAGALPASWFAHRFDYTKLVIQTSDKMLKSIVQHLIIRLKLVCCGVLDSS